MHISRVGIVPMKFCPGCQQSINGAAIVDAFLAPEGWTFWGDKEAGRWIVCQSPAYVHFRVNVRGRMHHRLAVIHAQATQWIETERAAAQVNGARNGRGDSKPTVAAKIEQEQWL